MRFEGPSNKIAFNRKTLGGGFSDRPARYFQDIELELCSIYRLEDPLHHLRSGNRTSPALALVPLHFVRHPLFRRVVEMVRVRIKNREDPRAERTHLAHLLGIENERGLAAVLLAIGADHRYFPVLGS
jgi:hypothetical protein